MELNREKLKRMFEDTKGNGGSANSGGGGGALAGYATQAWVNEGFVSIEFFNRLFTVYGPGETSSDPDVVIEPNDLDSTIKNIKAMFGLWTEQYLSALGLNPGGTGSATSLSMLDDVYITTPTNGQALVYNATSTKWENQTISTVTALANLTDVLLTSPAANQVLVYDGTQWVNSSVKTVNGYSIFGTGDIPASGGGTGNYLPLTGGTVTSTILYDIIGFQLKLRTTANTNIAILGSASGSPVAGGEYGIFQLFHNSIEKFRLYAVGENDNYASWVCYRTASGFGVGTNNPYSKLDVRGDIRVGTPGGFGYIGCTYTESNPSLLNYIRFGGLIDSQNDGVLFYTAGTYTSSQILSHRFAVYQHDYALVIQNTNGYVGIDTNSMTAKLTVNNGDIHVNNNTHTSVILRTNNEMRAQYGYNDIYGILIYNYVSNSGIRINNSGYVTIGNTEINSSYRLYVEGTIYATGAITALSDIKQKNIKEYMQLGIDDVANAPIIKFTWKDPKAEDKGLQIGSIAQYWEKVLPEAVKRDKEGTLSMSYGVVALVAAISTAKKVQEHERRIADLERENKDLKVRLRRLNRYGEY